MSKEMYQRAISFLDLPYPKERIVGSTSDGYLRAIINDAGADYVINIDNVIGTRIVDGYLRAIINDAGADYVINIDEDAFVTDVGSLRRLVEHVMGHGYVNCGMPDGGVVPIRHHHPLVTNPFFTIMNTAEIRKKWHPAVSEGFPIVSDDYLMTHPRKLLRSPYDMDGFEPYNELLVWMSRTFPTLYLDAEVHRDGRSTVLHDHRGKPFLIHTWFARQYLKDVRETKRIDDRIQEAARLNPAGRGLSPIDQARHWAVPRLKRGLGVISRASRAAR